MLARGELLLQVLLASVDDDEIGPQREDALEIRIEQRSHPLQLLHLRRVLVEAADRDHLRPCADGKENLRHRWNQRDDPLRRAGCRAPTPQQDGHDERDSQGEDADSAG